MKTQVNTTQSQYTTWLDTEAKLINNGLYEEDSLLYLESLYGEILDLIDLNISLLSGDDIDNTSTIGSRVSNIMEYVVASIDKEEEFATKGRVLETRFFDACRRQHGCTNIVRASVQEDILASTDFFVFGFRVDITMNDKKDSIVARDIYSCENNGLICTANIINSNKQAMLPAPVLSLRFSGNTDGYMPLLSLVKTHLVPMLLEFNRMVHVLGL